MLKTVEKLFNYFSKEKIDKMKRCGVRGNWTGCLVGGEEEGRIAGFNRPVLLISSHMQIETPREEKVKNQLSSSDSVSKGIR